MNDIIIYHNPRCSKSKATLELITSMGITPIVKLYLEEQISYDELSNILDKLNITPRELLRKNESLYKKYDLDNNILDDAEIIKLMIENPILIERPIVIRNKRAIIGRPPENVLKIINK
jgi:arsenate reductase